MVLLKYGGISRRHWKGSTVKLQYIDERGSGRNREKDDILVYRRYETRRK